MVEIMLGFTIGLIVGVGGLVFAAYWHAKR